MFFKSKSFSFLLAALLVFASSAAALADTIRLKDGTVIKGKVIGFKDQQFIVVVGDGATRASTRRSQMSLYIEDVESIEFDSETGAPGNNRIAENTQPVRSNPPSSSGNNSDNSQSTSKPAVIVSSNLPREQKPTSTTNQSGGLSQVINSQPTAPASVPANNSSNNPRPNSGKFFSLNIKVLADSTANGWTNAGLVVKKGQRLRISSTGRVSLGQGRFATPAGVGSIADSERLMQTEPTGALIAVIGDDNNDFVFIGSNREFVAPRDGTLFLGINEGNLDDNSGSFDAVIEAEAVDAAPTASRR